MANMTCKVLNVLGLHPCIGEGRVFCEAMAAFIVGSGMHSYYEAYKSFNLYAKELVTHRTQTEMIRELTTSLNKLEIADKIQNS